MVTNCHHQKNTISYHHDVAAVAVRRVLNSTTVLHGACMSCIEARVAGHAYGCAGLPTVEPRFGTHIDQLFHTIFDSIANGLFHVL